MLKIDEEWAFIIYEFQNNKPEGETYQDKDLLVRETLFGLQNLLLQLTKNQFTISVATYKALKKQYIQLITQKYDN